MSSSREACDAASIYLSKETLEAIYRKEVMATEPAPLRDATHVVGSGSWSAEADSLGEMKAMPTDKTSDDDSGDVGATGADDTPGTESDTDKDPSAKENDEENTPTGTAPEGAGAPDTHVPDLPDVSDKKGVKLELSSSESTDTVFYRLELKTYINGILANPPKTLSVEKIETLKKIKAYWLNILAPQCVHDILRTVISLPKMFRIKS